MLGDFNINYNERNPHSDFKTTIKLFGFKQMVTKPMRITKDTATTIDLAFSNKPFNITISDHEMIACVRKLNNPKHDPKVIKCCDYKNYDPEKLKSDFENVNTFFP